MASSTRRVPASMPISPGSTFPTPAVTQTNSTRAHCSVQSSSTQPSRPRLQGFVRPAHGRARRRHVRAGRVRRRVPGAGLWPEVPSEVRSTPGVQVGPFAFQTEQRSPTSSPRSSRRWTRTTCRGHRADAGGPRRGDHDNLRGRRWLRQDLGERRPRDLRQRRSAGARGVRRAGLGPGLEVVLEPVLRNLAELAGARGSADHVVAFAPGVGLEPTTR